tara:strand:+ start:115158 stop:115916 length:759 start_codon:yes stop_codon:yes gene_type:complete
MRVFSNWIIGLFSVAILGCSSPKKEAITIAAAANMQFALKELTLAFTEETGVKCDVILGSSAKMNAQIKEGAPYDIFISADMAFPQNLYKSGFTINKPKVYAYGNLVLWSFQKEITPSLEILTESSIKHIAIANPKTAPYGIAAAEVLQAKNLNATIASKLVFGENVGQTNQFIITGAAEVGITAKSVVMSPIMKGKGLWMDIPNTLYAPISQGIVLLHTDAKRAENAQKFYDFMFTDKAKLILVKYGYKVP